MIGFRKAAALGLALAGGLALGGCVTVFPKAKPAQLYRFGQDAPPSAEAPGGQAPSGRAPGEPINVVRASTVFVGAAASDRILTSNGDQTAYIADARWVSAAPVLFDEAETRAFAAGGPVRLISRGQPASGAFSLRLDVQTFEARYLDGPGAAPTIVVAVSGDLTRMADRQIVASELFEVRRRAANNHLGPIVTAFDQATSEALAQVTRWTATQSQASPIQAPVRP